jgi:hypothetical protein
MNEPLQHAMASMAAVSERARYLTRDEQEALAMRVEALAEDLHWEQYFHLPDRLLADHVIGESDLPQAQHGEPPAPSSLTALASVAHGPTSRVPAGGSRIPPSRPGSHSTVAAHHG